MDTSFADLDISTTLPDVLRGDPKEELAGRSDFVIDEALLHQYILPGWNFLVIITTLTGNSFLILVSKKFMNLQICTYFYILNLAVAQLLFGLAHVAGYFSEHGAWDFGGSLWGCGFFKAALHAYDFPRTCFIFFLVLDRLLAVSGTWMAEAKRREKMARISTMLIWLLTALIFAMRGVVSLRSTNGCNPHSLASVNKIPLYLRPVPILTVPVLVIMCIVLIMYALSRNNRKMLHHLLHDVAEPRDLNALVLVLGIVFFFLPLPMRILQALNVSFHNNDATDPWVFAVALILAQADLAFNAALCFSLSSDYWQGFTKFTMNGDGRISTKAPEEESLHHGEVTL